MKRFIKYTLVFLLPVMAIGVFLEILLRNIPNDYAFKKNYLDKNSTAIKILFLGNSHIYYGVNPEYIQAKSFNASHISQTVSYDLEILKKYQKQLDSLKCIVVSLDYFTLYFSFKENAESWRNKNYNLYYGIHTTREIKYFSEILSNNLQFNFTRLYDFYYLKKPAITCTESGWGTIYNSKNAQDLIKTGKEASIYHRVRNDKFFQGNVSDLISIINFAKKRNCKVILLTAPAYKSYVENLNVDQLNNTINEGTKLSKENPNTTYLNLLNDKSFEAEDFYDANHLNEIGARKLTLKLDSVISGLITTK